MEDRRLRSSLPGHCRAQFARWGPLVRATGRHVPPGRGSDDLRALAMQRACADLARHNAAWATSLGDLPRGIDGRTREVWFLAAAARGVLEVAGVANTRAALAFWATEDDPAVLTVVTQGLPPETYLSLR